MSQATAAEKVMNDHVVVSSTMRAMRPLSAAKRSASMTTLLALGSAAGSALVKKINEEIQRGLAKPDVAARMRRDGMIVDPMTPEQYAAFIDRETKVWSPVMQASGLTKK